MKGAAWMVGGSLAAAAAAVSLTGRELASAVLLGMAGPLLMAVGSWVMAERAWRHDPQTLTGRMTMAFAFKLVFFGGYVAVMLRILHLRPVPFVVSFSSYFIALHFVEALLLRRLFASDPRA